MACNPLEVLFGEAATAYATISALRAGTADLVNGRNVIVNGGDALGDMGGGVFTWIAASLAADDGRYVVRPDSLTPLQAGRWVLIGGPGTELAGKADTDMANVGEYEAQPVSLIGDQVTTAAAFKDPTMGSGGSKSQRHWLIPRVNGVLTDFPNGGSMSSFGITAYVGGDKHNTVYEAVNVEVIYDTASPICTNANTVGIQARFFAKGDGRVKDVNGNPNYMVGFAMAGYVAGGPTATNFNLCGFEIDAGYANTTGVLRGRTAYLGLSMGSQKAALGEDAAFVAAAGPQFQTVQTQGQAGWRSAFLVHGGFAGPGYGEPVSADGRVFMGTGSWNADYLIDFQSQNFSHILTTPTYDLTPTGAVMRGLNHTIELGAFNTPNMPRLDFHSGTIGTDYDATISASGGTGTPGQGDITITASNLIHAGAQIAPAGDNLQNLGTPSKRFGTIYLGSNPVVTSDERIKEGIEDLDPAKWAGFVLALRPVFYTYRDIDTEDVYEMQTVTRAKTQTVMRPVYRDVTIDGVRTWREVMEPRDETVMEMVPMLDADGQPVMEMLADTTRPLQPVTGGDGVTRMRHPMVPTPKLHPLPVMETVEEPVLVRPASDVRFQRRHVGFIAQEVRAALAASGLENEADMARSVWALFVYDAEADMFALRYEQFVAILTSVMQGLLADVAALKEQAA